MTTQLTFNKMKPLAQEIFGLELVRSGKQFKLLDGDVALGEGHGDLWTLRDIKAMFQEWLIHPDAYDFFSPEFRAKLGFNSPVQCLSDKEVADTVEFIVDEIRVGDMKSKALEAGIRVVENKGGFHLFDAIDGEHMGFDDDPWPLEDVVDFCLKQKEFKRTGVFVA